VIHGKPFLSTVASARDWVEMERIHAGLAPDRSADRFHDFGHQTVALIAHDAMKPAMLDFAARNFELLALSAPGGYRHHGAEAQRTGLEQGLAGRPPWVDRFNSGPLGGDAQIADLVLERRCQRAIFFEDPHVARQHEADIQLLERAVTTITHEAVCATSPAVAQRWCDAAVRRAGS
jgi:methylglyoxal synthase